MPQQQSQLTTSWIRIATAGETIDGRVIEPQWLIDMAETYDPDVYTALIWPEHERWFGSCGEVLALHSEAVEGVQRLFAKLCPSVDLIMANKHGQLLFGSIEPTQTLNFRGTGKPYLEGLGVTNQPASIGAERLRFSSEKTGRIFGGLEPLVFSEFIEEGNQVTGKDKNKQGGMSKLRRLFSIEEPKAEDATVDEVKEPEGLAEKLEALALAVSDLDLRLVALEKTTETVEQAVEEVQEVVESAEFKTLKAGFKDLAGKFSKLDEVTTRIPSKTPGGSPEKTNFNLV